MKCPWITQQVQHICSVASRQLWLCKMWVSVRQRGTTIQDKERLSKLRKSRPNQNHKNIIHPLVNMTIHKFHDNPASTKLVWTAESFTRGGSFWCGEGHSLPLWSAPFNICIQADPNTEKRVRKIITPDLVFFGHWPFLVRMKRTLYNPPQKMYKFWIFFFS